MANSNPFYGTPLSKSLETNNEISKDGPINQRRARLNQLQTVKDDQGRQRFHGAFTGGFSAGYYNTVGTAEGFRPRQFITHRTTTGSRNVASSSRFIHKPEDYMDDEDLGEFGIAPRKIRITNRFATDIKESSERQDDSIRSTLKNILRPSAPSLGEKILRCMNAGSNQNREYQVRSLRETSTSVSIVPKNDFHGLGYRPLKCDESSSRFMGTSSLKNPLTAILNDGKRLKISGDAFGTGVLEEDEDCSEAYGYDDVSNYEFKSKSSSEVKKRSSNDKCDTHDHDHNQLSGFVLATKLDSLNLFDIIKKEYPPPSIPQDWVMPVRKEPYLPPSKSSTDLTFQPSSSSSSFNKKFISGSSSLKVCDLEKKAGLLSYSDLKATEGSLVVEKKIIKEPECIEVSVKREVLEWHPCSLLCVRFNVPNPYPDSSFVGVKPSELTMKIDDLNLDKHAFTTTTTTHQDICYNRREASAELKKSIFNIVFDETHEDLGEIKLDDQTSCDSEDEPQVVEVKGDYDEGDGNQKEERGDEDLDIVIVAAPKREPEVIVLDSSSSSSSSPASLSPTQSTRKKSEKERLHQESLDEHDVELYGPPLPPTLRTLMDVDRSVSSRHQRMTKRKRKKHKKSKRIGSSISG